MSEAIQPPRENKNPAPGSHHKLGFPSSRLRHAVTLAALVLVIVYNIGELLTTTGVDKLAKDQSMFSIPTEMSDRYNFCDYRFLFFCEPKSNSIPAACLALTGVARATCILTDNGQAGSAPSQAPGWTSIPIVKLVVGAVVILPRLPDATIHMLQSRWARGRLEFSLGLVFVFAYITLMVVALRQESSTKLWAFAAVVVAGPYLVIGIFWLFQHALAGASAGAEKFAAFMVASLGLPACLLVCIKHDAASLGKVIKGVH
jgi:hypothetical protein